MEELRVTQVSESVRESKSEPNWWFFLLFPGSPEITTLWNVCQLELREELREERTPDTIMRNLNSALKRKKKAIKYFKGDLTRTMDWSLGSRDGSRPKGVTDKAKVRFSLGQRTFSL